MIKASDYNDALTELATQEINHGIAGATFTPAVQDTFIDGNLPADTTALLDNQSKLCYTDVPLPPSEMPESGKVIYRLYLDKLQQITDDFRDLIACSDCIGTCFNSCTGSCSGSCSGACAGSCSGRKCQGSCSSGANSAVAVCTFLFPGAQAAAACGGCTNACDGGCQGNCGGGCRSGCSNTCAGGCNANCYQTCKNSCSNGCAGTARIGAFEYQNASAST